ncbi:MAG TPA: amidohydrolase family protein [Solirubrobacteraceae bacterium]|nr:amidohydrolase family protein [Solirubrobacteraceae bacterium]
MLLTNARVIDGTGRAPLECASVRVADGRIAEVVSEGGAPDAGLEAAVDLGGRTLMPGLIDAHAHLSSDISRSPGFGPPPALHGELPRPRELGYFVLAKTARVLLAAGVTTVRDVGSYDDEAIALREAVRLGIVEGPRILSCGRIISATAPGGAIFTTMYREADGPDDMRKAVREQLRRGADYVKLMATGARSVLAEDPEPAQMTAAELAAIVDEAHRLGVRVAAHVEGLAGARLAVLQGVDTIEHGLSLHREPALLAAMAERGIVLVPTLSTFHDLAERFTDDFAPALVEQAKRQLEQAYATLAAARDAGVALAMGHDSGPPGENAIELVRMVDGGLPALDGVRAATSGSATALGLGSKLGTVTAGAVADLLVIDGDPLADIRMLCDPERIWMVVQGGKVVAGHVRATALTPA